MCTPPSSITFEALYERHYHQSLVYAIKQTGNYHDAEDIVQHAFYKMWLNFSTIVEEKAGSWLHQVIGRLAIDLYRYKQRKPTICLSEAFHVPVEAVDSDKRMDDEQELRTLFLGMPPAAAHMLIAYTVRGDSCKELAKVHGIQPASVKNRITRTRAMLRERHHEHMEQHG